MTPVTSPTEQRSDSTRHIDLLSTREVLAVINAEDATVPPIVSEALDVLAEVVDAAVDRVRRGGRVHYFGAGSSGRFGVLDAAEVPPTFGVEPGLVVAHLAGGAAAMTGAVEEAEDLDGVGEREAGESVNALDVVIGLAASGRTPYVAGAIRVAREVGAFTAVVTSNPRAPLAEIADRHVCVPTGAEVITGSTRMKAGTAQKVVLHTFSTAFMIRLGRTYSNLMVDVVPTNAKLRQRVLRILAESTGCTPEAAVAALGMADGDTKVALIHLLTGADAHRARTTLDAAGQSVRSAVKLIRPSRKTLAADLGIDVGASGYRLVVRAGDRTLDTARGETRPVIRANGIDLGDVLAKVSARLRELGSNEHAVSIRSVVLGCAGVGAFGSRVDTLARDLAVMTGAERVAVASDRVCAYVGALGLTPGAVLAAGTGAVAVGTDAMAKWITVDGLGHLLGDLGSGAWIGVQALRVALSERAGWPASSPALTAAFRDQFGDVDSFVHDLYTRLDRPAVLASFVPAVLEIAPDDPVVAEIVNQAAQHLSTTLLAAARTVPGGPVALSGGLLSPGSLVRDLVVDRLATHDLNLSASGGSAVDGALLLARGRADGVLPEVFAQQLTARCDKEVQR